ncbi:MAG: T9SS type A sorting domain-containing protein, partial [Lentimicrobiaceae bacterium]|nr:T9SS type A sorting domain-containing protein [Lentimicrobiaceae bacterium]
FTLFTRFSNDTVYRYVNNREYLYFNFNSEVGDVYTTFRSAGHNYTWNDSACTAVLPIKTMQVDSMLVNSVLMRRTILRDTLFSTIYGVPEHDAIEYTLIERIGIIDGLPLINSQEMEGYGQPCSLPSDWASYTLGNYSDDGLSVQFSTCLGVGIDELDVKMDHIKVYPNPANEYLVFQLPDAIVNSYLNRQSIFIFDIYGRPVAEVAVTGKETLWPAGDLAPGVYFYKFSNGKYTNSGRFVILE